MVLFRSRAVAKGRLGLTVLIDEVGCYGEGVGFLALVAVEAIGLESPPIGPCCPHGAGEVGPELGVYDSLMLSGAGRMAVG
jgi:hypothetical protein